MKRKLTKEEKFAYAKNVTLFSDYVVEFNNYGIVIKKELKLWVYILIFIPYCLVEMAYTIWDNGLRYFSLPPKTLAFTHYYNDNYDLFNNRPIIQKLLKESKNTIDNKNQ